MNILMKWFPTKPCDPLPVTFQRFSNLLSSFRVPKYNLITRFHAENLIIAKFKRWNIQQETIRRLTSPLLHPEASFLPSEDHAINKTQCLCPANKIVNKKINNNKKGYKKKSKYKYFERMQ